MEITFKLVDGILVTEATPEQAEAAGFREGQRLVVVATKDGVELRNAEMQDDMALVEQIMKEDEDVLRKLAL